MYFNPFHCYGKLVLTLRFFLQQECGCFGVRAARLMKAMQAKNSGISFTVNPEKAPKGEYFFMDVSTWVGIDGSTGRERASPDGSPFPNTHTSTHVPKTGSFVLRTEGGKELWSMKGLVRPFPSFKAVDFEELGAKLAASL